MPRGALAVLAIATVLFFSGFGLHSDFYDVVAPIIWTGFVAGWVLWLRHGRRAIPGRPSRARDERRRDIALWVGLFIVANLIVVLGSRVSWVLVGVLFALLGASAGASAAWRGRRS
jgi:hypothetical protein